MTELSVMIHDNPQRSRRLLPAGRSDIYTLLLVIAVVALALAIGFVGYRTRALFDTTSPFQIVPLSHTNQGIVFLV